MKTIRSRNGNIVVGDKRLFVFWYDEDKDICCRNLEGDPQIIMSNCNKKDDFQFNRSIEPYLPLYLIHHVRIPS